MNTLSFAGVTDIAGFIFNPELNIWIEYFSWGRRWFLIKKLVDVHYVRIGSSHCC